MPPNRHIYFFDLVRALAAQAVLIGHLRNVVFPATFLVAQPNGLLAPLPDAFEFENLGVLAFFIISGFLITRSAQTSIKRGGTFAEYIIARASRIGTPFIALLAVLFVVERQLYADGQNLQFLVVQLDWQTLILNATMLFNNPVLGFIANSYGVPGLSAGVFGTMAQAWTLVLEWWIYVAFGVAFYVSRLASGWNAKNFAVFFLACIVPINSLANGSGLLIAWLIGMTAAILETRLREVRKYISIAVACVSLIIAVLRCYATSYDLYDIVFSTFASISLIAIYFSFSDSTIFQRKFKIVSLLSDISYSLYLTHLSVLIAFAVFLPEFINDISTGMVLYILCNLVGWLFYWLVERHYPLVTSGLMTFARKFLGPDRLRPSIP